MTNLGCDLPANKKIMMNNLFRLL